MAVYPTAAVEASERTVREAGREDERDALSDGIAGRVGRIAFDRERVIRFENAD